MIQAALTEDAWLSSLDVEIGCKCLERFRFVLELNSQVWFSITDLLCSENLL